MIRKKRFRSNVNKNRFSEKKKCRFCLEKLDVLDYRDPQQLHKMTNSQGKLFSRRRSGNCAKHQRMAKVAVKRARFMALIPYI